ncbi:hypothetical protein BSKO_13568 [Bryopsis sp. KO-2023]|nr:hypothetical protein BSKO_13568 [Bryopsis sp. KO-2023]
MIRSGRILCSNFSWTWNLSGRSPFGSEASTAKQIAAVESCPPSLKAALDSVGVSPLVWKQKWSIKEKRYGHLHTSQSNLEHNLKLLEKWGMEMKDRKRTALSTYTMVRSRPKIIEEKLEWIKNTLDLNEKEVMKIVRVYPNILQYSMGENVGPFLESFLAGGFSRQHVKAVVLKMPRMLGYGSKFRSMESFFVKKVGLEKADVLRFVMAFPNAFTYSLEQNMFPSIEKYFELGLTKSDILRFIREAPSLVAGRDYEKTIQCKIDWLMDDLGFDKERALNVLRLYPRTFFANLEVWRETFDYLTSLGNFAKPEAIQFLESNMVLLGLNVEGLKEKVAFAKQTLGKSVEDIVEFPQYLGTPFENVLCMRVAFLRHKGIRFQHMGLHEFCEKQTEVFFERFDETEFLDVIDKWKKLSRTEKAHAVENGFPW